MRPRGSAGNPPNRFEALRYEPSAREAHALSESNPETRLLADPSRTIVATNQSPDVGFDASVNPYRGCEHACSYCLGPETPVLFADMVWRPIGDVRAGDTLVGFDEFPAPGRTRKLRHSVVEAVWWSRKPSLHLITDAARIVTTAEHRWFGDGSRWRRTDRLDETRWLARLPVEPSEPFDSDYQVGYISGLSLSDGTFRYESGSRSDKLGFPAAYWRVALIDREPLFRLVAFLSRFGIQAHIRGFTAGRQTASEMWKVEVRSLSRLAIIAKLLEAELESRSYRRGFLAGFFDAEGHNGSSLRLSQVDVNVLLRVQRMAASLGLRFDLERQLPGRASTLRLIGTMADRIRFFSICQPAIRRKREAVFGFEPASTPDPVRAVEPGAQRDVVDIQTSTRTFFAAGLATHNCYARPTHEYLGFSAGLDFETRILVKERAPELLRQRLAARSWKPQVVALSGVTDPYQPAERRLELTRRCLTVLAEFRNPVAIITKSFLVTRDVDLLAELAGIGAASVAVSITTLDPELARRMEPYAAPPRKRLAAIERLAVAGVPVGVMVAPVVPGLTDHESPKILAAAAAAGAGFAGRVVLRLPHGVAELFEAWLALHYPERRQKVMARIRAVRGGAAYDARFGVRQRGTGRWADEMAALFALARRRAGLAERGPTLSVSQFRRPAAPGAQLSLL
jgi:DNA repair photolyase